MISSGQNQRWRIVLDSGALLGEGPVWYEPTHRLLWVDVEGGLVHETDIDTGADDTHEIGAPVSFVVPVTTGGFAVGTADGIAFLDIDWIEQHRIGIEAAIEASRMNDAKADPAGRLFAGTMTGDSRSSRLYRIDHDLSVHPVFERVAISNGLAWSPDHSKIYFIDSPTRQVDVADYDLTTGDVENRRLLAETPRHGGYPDGMTIDAEGCLWVAYWDGGCIRRIAPDGQILETVALPVRRPTSCAFGGRDYERLFVTSASTGLDGAERGAEPRAGALLEVSVAVGGAAPATFAGSWSASK